MICRQFTYEIVIMTDFGYIILYGVHFSQIPLYTYISFNEPEPFVTPLYVVQLVQGQYLNPCTFVALLQSSLSKASTCTPVPLQHYCSVADPRQAPTPLYLYNTIVCSVAGASPAPEPLYLCSTIVEQLVHGQYLHPCTFVTLLYVVQLVLGSST